MLKTLPRLASASAAVLLVGACGSGSAEPGPGGAQTSVPSVQETAEVAVGTVPVDPCQVVPATMASAITGRDVSADQLHLTNGSACYYVGADGVRVMTVGLEEAQGNFADIIEGLRAGSPELAYEITDLEIPQAEEANIATRSSAEGTLHEAYVNFRMDAWDYGVSVFQGENPDRAREGAIEAATLLAEAGSAEAS